MLVVRIGSKSSSTSKEALFPTTSTKLASRFEGGCRRVDSGWRSSASFDPVWGSLLSIDNLGFANYQSMEAEVSRRFSKGVSLQGAYTLAKHLGNAGGPAGGLAGPQVFPGEENQRVPTDRFNLGLDRGNLLPTRRHRFVLNAILPLPVGRNRWIASSLPRWVDAIAGGWDLSVIGIFQSGVFQTPTMGVGLDRSNTNVAGRFFTTARPDRVGDGNLPNPTRDRFYDISAFAPPPVGAGRYGNAGVGILRGPQMNSLSAGLFKTFTLSERTRLRLEGTFTNVANHPNFLAPSVVVSAPQSFGRLTTALSTESGGNRTGQVGVRVEF